MFVLLLRTYFKPDNLEFVSELTRQLLCPIEIQDHPDENSAALSFAISPPPPPPPHL